MESISFDNLVKSTDLFNKTKTKERRYICFDIESGLNIKDDVLQLSYIELDKDLKIVNIYNKYFKNQNKISNEAYNVHLLDEEFLHNNSDNFFVEETIKLLFFQDEKDDEYNYVFVTYSDFDYNKLNSIALEVYNESISLGKEMMSVPLIQDGRIYLDLLKTNPGKLVNHFSAEEMETYKRELSSLDFNKYGKEITAHNAIFDVYLLVKLLKRKSDLNK